MIAESLLRGNNSQNQEINQKEKYKACKILLAIFFWATFGSFKCRKWFLC